MLQYTVVVRTWSTRQLPKYTALHVILLLYECLLQTVTYMEKKSFEIRVNTEWLKKQQHQVENETILFLQGKIVKTAQENDTLNSYLISYIIKPKL